MRNGALVMIIAVHPTETGSSGGQVADTRFLGWSACDAPVHVRGAFLGWSGRSIPVENARPASLRGPLWISVLSVVSFPNVPRDRSPQRHRDPQRTTEMLATLTTRGAVLPQFPILNSPRA